MNSGITDALYNLHTLAGQCLGIKRTYDSVVDKCDDAQQLGGIVIQVITVKLCQVCEELRRLDEFKASDQKLEKLLYIIEPITNEFYGFSERLALSRQYVTVQTNRNTEGTFQFWQEALAGKLVKLDGLRYLMTFLQEVGACISEYYLDDLNKYYEQEAAANEGLERELATVVQGTREVMLERIKDVILEVRRREEEANASQV
ncbi:MAG: hypothetical protein K0R82_3019 [Flavipsychrobacter sp.]|jgi:hypothetical protein|nr:hypothetical protein [Flavipsychrobacter sp.]